MDKRTLTPELADRVDPFSTDQVDPFSIDKYSGNKISVRTLDLNTEFDAIMAQLNGIVGEHFGIY